MYGRGHRTLVTLSPRISTRNASGYLFLILGRLDSVSSRDSETAMKYLQRSPVLMILGVYPMNIEGSFCGLPLHASPLGSHRRQHACHGYVGGVKAVMGSVLVLFSLVRVLVVVFRFVVQVFSLHFFFRVILAINLGGVFPVVGLAIIFKVVHVVVIFLAHDVFRY